MTYRSSLSTASFAFLIDRMYWPEATVTMIPMMATTTISSMSVNPRSPLPVRILRPVESGRPALRPHVEDVDSIGELRSGPVAARPRGPLPLPGDRIDGNAPDVLELRALGVADVESAVEPLELLRVAVLVRGVELAPDPREAVHVGLEAVDRGAHLTERLPELELLLPLHEVLRDGDRDPRDHEDDRGHAHELDQGHAPRAVARTEDVRHQGSTTTEADRKLAGRFRACGSLTLADVKANPLSPAFRHWNWSVASVPDPVIPSPPPMRERPTTTSPPAAASCARNTVPDPSLERKDPSDAGGTYSRT